jgi:hypothetical protein
MADRGDLTVPALEAVARISVNVGEAIEVGRTVRGRRRIIPIMDRISPARSCRVAPMCS